MPDLGYVEREEHLGRGDLIAIYSDGITEANNPTGEEFGQDRLAELLVGRRGEPAREIVAAVNEALGEWSASDVADDDVTLIVARRTDVTNT
jgi:serine phosphatase RsbU (regulator of sigma subunit)